MDLETSIQQFLDLGRELQRIRVTAETALERLVDWYESTRIDGTNLDHDEDMLLLQWGSIRPLRIAGPTDLRRVENFAADAWEDDDYLFIDLTRQVFAPEPDSDAEFDDSAVQMAITLCYEPGEQRGSNIWIPTPNDIAARVADFRAIPFVNGRLADVATRTVVTVGKCG